MDTPLVYRLLCCLRTSVVPLPGHPLVCESPPLWHRQAKRWGKNTAIPSRRRCCRCESQNLRIQTVSWRYLFHVGRKSNTYSNVKGNRFFHAMESRNKIHVDQVVGRGMVLCQVRTNECEGSFAILDAKANRLCTSHLQNKLCAESLHAILQNSSWTIAADICWYLIT